MKRLQHQHVQWTLIRSMVVFLSILVSASFASGQSGQIAQLAGMMADRMERVGVQSVAVADFTDLQGNVTELGRYLAEQFSVALAGSGRSLVVVDRLHLKTLLQEHKLASSDTALIDPSTARQLGKIAGVQALVTGSLTPFGDTVEMAIKVLDTETAKIFDARTESLPKTKTIQELLERGITTGATTSGTTVTTSSAPIKSEQSVRIKGLTFSNPICKRAGETVTCNVLVITNGQDKSLDVFANNSNTRRSRIIDDLGNDYSAKTVYVADKNSTSRVTDILFPNGIPTKVIFNFEEVSQEARTVSIVVYCYDNDTNEDFNAQLRNIPLTK